MEENYIRYRVFIIPAGILVGLLSIIVMIGWINHQDILTSMIPGYASMKFNTALSLLVLCITILILRIRMLYRLSQLLAIFAFSVGMLSFVQHMVHYDFHFDRFFFKHDDPMEGNHFHVFLMSPQTGFCISCMGAALLWTQSESRKYRLISQVLLHIVTATAFLVLLGYLYRIPNLHNFSFVSSMAVPTALGFLLLSVAASLLNPQLGIMGLFTGQMMGNLMARRLFFPMLGGIILLGYLRMITHRNNVLPVELGIALLIAVYGLIMLLLIGIVAKLINKSHITLANAKENLKLIIEAAPYALVMSDSAGTILDINVQAEKMFGYSRSELLGKSVALLVPSRMRESWMKTRSSFFNSPSIRTFSTDDGIYSIRKNNQEFPIEIILTPIRNEEGYRILSFVVDITARKQNEQIIKNQLAELQFKNQELEQFNYISSHDLQEPLRTATNYVQLLHEDYPGLDPEVKTHLITVQRTLNRMSEVVSSLLNYGKLGRNKKLSKTNVRFIIDDVIADLHVLIEKQQATITVNCDLPELFAYETELRQLLQNLITNAVKFKNDHIPPHVTISCRSTDGSYEFSVADNGIGIAEEDQEKIFHIFQRLDRAKGYEGHGIGLANCKKIAEMHGGRIWVESEPGEGSTFKFTILNFKP